MVSRELACPAPEPHVQHPVNSDGAMSNAVNTKSFLNMSILLGYRYDFS